MASTNSLLQSLTVVRWPSPDGSPRHPRDSLLLRPRCLIYLLSFAFVHLSASTPASSLSSGPVLRSPHVSRIGYYLIDDVGSDGVHLSSLNLAAPYHTGSRVDDFLHLPQVASHYTGRLAARPQSSHGNGHHQTRLSPSQDEAATPASGVSIRAERSQTTSTIPFLLFSFFCVETSPGVWSIGCGECHRRSHGEWRQWRVFFEQFQQQGFPNSTEKGCATNR